MPSTGRTNRNQYAPERGGAEGPCQARHDGHAQRKPFVWPRGKQDEHTHGEQDCVAEPGLPPEARPGAEDQRAAERAQRSAPVAVHPITEQAQAQRPQHAPEQRPFRRHPRLQHPAERAGHQREAQHDAGPRCAGCGLAERQEQRLARQVHRAVGRLLDHVNGFEVGPQRMRRVGQAAVRQRVREEQMTVFVGDQRLRRGRAPAGAQVSGWERAARRSRSRGPGVPRSAPARARIGRTLSSRGGETRPRRPRPGPAR